MSLFSDFCFGLVFPRAVSILFNCWNWLRAGQEERAVEGKRMEGDI